LIAIDKFFDNDVIMSSLVTNLNTPTAQEIVNWVTTADGCVHTADTTQLDFAVGKSVQFRLVETVANITSSELCSHR